PFPSSGTTSPRPPEFVTSRASRRRSRLQVRGNRDNYGSCLRLTDGPGVRRSSAHAAPAETSARRPPARSCGGALRRHQEGSDAPEQRIGAVLQVLIGNQL